MSQVLPKNRGKTPNGSRVGSGVRFPSNRRHISGRHVSRNFNSDDTADTSDIIHFNENKHTILSNFEEWIRLSTDNKITSKNSWNFALIDYFHDLNVIKDGEKINFQRASATLDGCVKIYLSRVESAATETGKLLSGLSNKPDHLEGQQDENDKDNNENEDEEDDESDPNAKRQRKINRIVESTLVTFDSLKIKKLDQELNIDPLFKKALSEFDEGGAKSLLLNTLNIDSTGRVVFDATTKPADDTDDIAPETTHTKDEDAILSQPHENAPPASLNINLSKIEKMLNVSNMNDYTICPSIDEFQNAIEDFSKAKSILNDFNNKYNEDTPMLVNNDENINSDINVEDNADFGDDFDVPDFDAGFDNESSHNEDNDAINNFNKSVLQQVFEEAEPEKSIHVTTNSQILDRDLMAYFDDRMKTNWQGPEHWKVSALKKSKNLEVEKTKPLAKLTSETSKKNQSVVIDFFEFDDVEMEDKMFEGPKNPSTIVKKNVDSGDTKLPDDIRYNSSRLTNLFTKSQVSIVYFPNKKEHSDSNTLQPLTDENFFAEQYKEQEEADRIAQSFQQAEYDDYNEDFGGDDGFNDIDFNDALEGNVDEKTKDEEGDKKLVLGQRRNDYVSFSRVAKRVDIKLLKDNIWNTIKSEEKQDEIKEDEIKEDETKENEIKEDENEKEVPEQENDDKKVSKKFATVVNSVGKLYGLENRKELSTSFCFICLLHLANEHGLTINANENNDDLEIIGF